MTYIKFTGLFIRICIKLECQVQRDAVESEEKKREKMCSKRRLDAIAIWMKLVGWEEVRNVQMAWGIWNNCFWLTFKAKIKSCSSVMWGWLFEGGTFLAGYSVEQCLANKQTQNKTATTKNQNAQKLRSQNTQKKKERMAVIPLSYTRILCEILKCKDSFLVLSAVSSGFWEHCVQV